METLLFQVSTLLLLVVVVFQRRKLVAVANARRKHTRLPR